jgi:outer membrane protein assembly factor BamB
MVTAVGRHLVNSRMNDPKQETVSAGSVPRGSASAAKFRTLRVWPALLLVVLMVMARFGPAYMEGGQSDNWMIAVFGPLLCCVLILIWWLAASRATWKERVFGFLGVIAGLAVTLALVHPTMRGPGTTYLTAPMGMLLFALSAAWLAKRRPVVRTGFAVLLALVGFSYSILLRNEGMTGEYVMDTHWRWTTTAEAMLLAARSSESPASATQRTGVTTPMTSEAFANPEWPGFRGADRAARSRGGKLPPTGPRSRLGNCGKSQLAQRGRPSRSRGTSFSRRSNAVRWRR